MLDVPLVEATDEALAGFGRIVSPLALQESRGRIAVKGAEHAPPR